MCVCVCVCTHVRVCVICADEGVTKDGYLPFHEYGHNVISERFQQLGSVLANCSSMKLTNDKMDTGAYAWIVCNDPSVNCSQLLMQVNLIGTSGVEYGASEQGVLHYIRKLVLYSPLFTHTHTHTQRFGCLCYYPQLNLTF